MRRIATALSRHGAVPDRSGSCSSVIATPLVAIFVGPIIPPGNGTAQAHAAGLRQHRAVGDHDAGASSSSSFLVYVLVVFRSRDAAELARRPADARRRAHPDAWIVVTTRHVLFLAGFGTLRAAPDGAGGGQGPNAAFRTRRATKALDVQVIAQQWEFTYRYPTYGGVEMPHLVLPATRSIGCTSPRST